jgi:hypothetical protein
MSLFLFGAAAVFGVAVNFAPLNGRQLLGKAAVFRLSVSPAPNGAGALTDRIVVLVFEMDFNRKLNSVDRSFLRAICELTARARDCRDLGLAAWIGGVALDLGF